VLEQRLSIQCHGHNNKSKIKIQLLEGERNLTFFIFINMRASQSQFSILPKKQLLFIAEKLIDEDFPVGNPYSTNFDNTNNILKNVGKYFNITVTQEDVEFFSKFLEINENILSNIFENPGEQKTNKELIEQLEIPVAKSYNLNYVVWGSCTYTSEKVQEFDSYDKEWVKESVTQQIEDGNWDTWNGVDINETEYENFEQSDYNFEEVDEVDENPVRESLLSKLVLENTSDVIDSLDRTTLIKLKNLINKKLSS